MKKANLKRSHTVIPFMLYPQNDKIIGKGKQISGFQELESQGE